MLKPEHMIFSLRMKNMRSCGLQFTKRKKNPNNRIK